MLRTTRPDGMLNLCPTHELTDFEGSFPHALRAGSTTISNGRAFVCIAFYPRSDSAETTTDIIISGQFGKVVICLAAQSNFGEVHFARASCVASHLNEHQSPSLERNTISIAQAE